MENLEQASIYDPAESLVCELSLAFEKQLWSLATRRAVREGRPKILADDVEYAGREILRGDRLSDELKGLLDI